MTMLRTLAIQANRMEPMTAFYREAFGFQFRNVDVGGLACQFGVLDGLELKLVPIRSSTDFENFPIHQLGFEVDYLAEVLASAERHGGRIQNEPVRNGDQLHAAIRDPDGNTIELYGPR